MPRVELQAELRRVAGLLSEASRSLARLAELLAAEVGEAPRPPVQAEPPGAGKQEEPSPAGEKRRRRRRAESAPPEKAKRVINWPWEKIVAAALEVVRAEPDRVWKMAELSRAVQKSGLGLETLKGMHFGLVARLKQLGALEETEDGRLRAIASVIARRSTVVPKTPPPPPREKDEVDQLAEEIDLGRPYLDGLSKQKRTAQVCVWAGLARALQDRLDGSMTITSADLDKKGRLHAVFGRLSSITRELMCDWVDALTRHWRTDWAIYVEHHKARVAGRFADLPPEKLAILRRDTLKGLANRLVSAKEAELAILEAAQVLAADDPDLLAAVVRFGRPQGLGAPPSSDTKRVDKRSREDPSGIGSKNGDTAAERVEIPPEVLAWTKGKRALMAGGQGERPEQRETIEQALGFAELEWVTGERNQSSPFERLEGRMRPGRYDLVIYLASYSSHKAGVFVRSVKDAEIPLVYINRGYSLSSIVHAIQEQLVGRRAAAAP